MKRLLIALALAGTGLVASLGGADAHHRISHNGTCYQGLGGTYCTVDENTYKCYLAIAGYYCDIDGVWTRI